MTKSYEARNYLMLGFEINQERCARDNPWLLLQVEEAEAPSHTAAALQQILTELQGKLKLTITYQESERGLLEPALLCEIELANFSQNAKISHYEHFLPYPCPQIYIIL